MNDNLSILLVPIEKPEDVNLILGQSHFIKTVEDIHEALVNSVPGIEFGIAFCEASGPSLVRWSGNSEELIELARASAFALSAGHSFIVFLRKAFPINVLGAIKRVPEVCTIFAATANPLAVVIAETDYGRGIIGVIDGQKSQGIEVESDIQERKELLRRFGYKL